MSRVLVTGGAGFLAGHVIAHALNAGHEVHTSLRDLARSDNVIQKVRAGGADPTGRLRFFRANLLEEGGWAEAVAGCDYVLHVASPFPSHTPKDDDELIRPAREGALRVLRAARDAQVKRVVMTSSFGAIGYGHGRAKTTFTEETWTNLEGADVTAYIKSKTLAERAAWDFIQQQGGALELAVINPVGIFGPVLGDDVGSSVQIVQQMLSGKMPAAPNVRFGVVDVRDVADLHLLAMVDPKAKGERFIGVAGETMSMPDVAKVLRTRLGAAAAAAPTRTLPDVVVRLMSSDLTAHAQPCAAARHRAQRIQCEGKRATGLDAAS